MKRYPGAFCAFLLASVFIASAFVSCRGREWSERLTLEPGSALGDGIGWGVVNEVYARVKASPSFAAPDRSNARRGDLVRLAERTRLVEPESDAGVWLRVEGDGFDGWLHERSLRQYRTRPEAEKARGDAP